jgi:hypothetical protein
MAAAELLAKVARREKLRRLPKFGKAHPVVERAC